MRCSNGSKRSRPARGRSTSTPAPSSGGSCRNGGPRSWRLLTASGVLQRALPELDDALELRLRAGYEIDPLAGLRFDRLNAVRELLAHAGGPASPDALLLAALDLSTPARTCRSNRSSSRGGPCSVSTSARRSSSRSRALVTDVNLLAGAARRLDALSEESVLALAVHLGTSEHARALYLLTMATYAGEEWERERIDALHDLIQDALARPELTGRAAANEVEHRKAEARGRDERRSRARTHRRRAARIRAEPTATDLLRHAELCEPTPGRNDIRVTVEPRRRRLPSRGRRRATVSA